MADITGSIVSSGPQTLTTGVPLLVTVSSELSVPRDITWGASVEISDGTKSWKLPAHTGMTFLTGIGPSYTDSTTLYAMPSTAVTLEITLYGATTGLAALDWYPTAHVISGPVTLIVQPTSSETTPPTDGGGGDNKGTPSWFDKYGSYVGGGILMVAALIVIVASSQRRSSASVPLTKPRSI